MKLLFDQNLSFRLVRALMDSFPGSVHVRDQGLKDADDRQVWEFAKQSGMAIISKDSDFQQRSMLYGHPPKVIWVSLTERRNLVQSIPDRRAEGPRQPRAGQ